MIVKQDVFRKIKDHFNLNIYETKVWLALLGKGIASAGEVAELSSVPRSRTYDVLESLEKRGFAVEKIGKPIKFIAVKPVIIIEKMKGDLMEEAKEKTDLLSNLSEGDDYKQLELIYKQGINPIKMEDLSGTLKGRRNIHVHLKDMIAKAEKSVVLITNVHAMKKKAKILKPVFESLRKKGVNTRIAISGDEKEIKGITKDIKADIKKTDLDARFCIVDNKHIMFMVTRSDDENDTGIWLNNEFFANSLGSMFDMAWGK